MPRHTVPESSKITAVQNQMICENCLGDVVKSGDTWLCLGGCGHVEGCIRQVRPTIEKLRELYLKYGDCKHPEEHYKKSRIQNIIITDCGICGERIDMEYTKL